MRETPASSLPAGPPTLAGPPPVLSCRQLTVGYGARIVLERMSLDFAAGQWCAVVGPNGCGKSTLLRALAGLMRPRAGSISLRGEDLHRLPRRVRARSLAWLAQTSSATDLTGIELVGLGRFAHGGWLAARQADDEAAMRRAMIATGSLAWSQRRVSSLSGGERQRIYLARALAVEAPVLLLDEPTTYLDPPHQEDVVRLLRDQAHRAGVCVVSAIHDLSMALAADRMIVLGARGMVGQGTVAQVLAGDWLSLAFETRIDVIVHEGAHLWRPALAGVPHG
jgi:iron complex transport system ATP-binding protein